jgi:hypothetical protein
MSYNGTVWTSTPAYAQNTKASAAGTKLAILNIPDLTTIIYVNGSYITDN